MRNILGFAIFSDEYLNEKQINSFYHDELCPIFWKAKKNSDGNTTWVFDQRIRKKLIRVANDFFSNFSEIIGNRKIKDIQLTGSLSNFNYTDFSDLDIHVMIDLSGIDDDNKKVLVSAINGIRFIWNKRHDISIRGYDAELYLQDIKEEHVASGLFSLMNNEWIKKPIFNPPEIDDRDIDLKYNLLSKDIEILHDRLNISGLTAANAKMLYARCIKLKSKIHKMRKEGLSEGGEMSIGNLVFKKLRNEGYIEKLIDIISKSYDKIYTEK
jgi:hypothetical protein